MNLSINQETLTKAFIKWEQDFRKDPSGFQHPASLLLNKTAQEVGRENGEHMFALLSEVAPIAPTFKIPKGKRKISAGVSQHIRSGFTQLTDITHAINVDKGFFTVGEKPNVDQQLLLIVGEVSEAHDAYRNDNAMDDKLPHRLGLEVELAHAVIRILNFGRQQGLDIAGAIIEKTEFNANRPHKHGKKF